MDYAELAKKAIQSDPAEAQVFATLAVAEELSNIAGMLNGIEAQLHNIDRDLPRVTG